MFWPNLIYCAYFLKKGIIVYNLNMDLKASRYLIIVVGMIVFNIIIFQVMSKQLEKYVTNSIIDSSNIVNP